MYCAVVVGHDGAVVPPPGARTRGAVRAAGRDAELDEGAAREAAPDPIRATTGPGTRASRGTTTQIGGLGPGVEDRLLEFGDEWLPQFVGPDNSDEFAARADALQQRAADAGRGRIPMSLLGRRPRWRPSTGTGASVSTASSMGLMALA